MSLYEQVQATVLSTIPAGDINTEIGEKLDCVFSGKCQDMDSLLEWVKTRPLLDDMTKAVLGLVMALTNPKESAIRARKFIYSPLLGSGGDKSGQKALQLTKKLKEIVTHHAAYETASSYTEAAIAKTLGNAYLRMGSISSNAMFGAICALCHKIAEGHHSSRNNMMRSKVPAIKGNMRMVQALSAARAAEHLGSGDDRASQGVYELAERTRSLINGMRSIGAAPSASLGLREEVIKSLGTHTSSMGISGSRLL